MKQLFLILVLKTLISLLKVVYWELFKIILWKLFRSSIKSCILRIIIESFINKDYLRLSINY